jgi:glycosylphosphatidylinositol transamidase (GPIT) subunit GPI8
MIQIRLLRLVLSVAALICTAYAQKALVMTSSVGYYNYRQQSNAMEVYRMLKEYGY